MKKLNFGCGSRIAHGWTNIDVCSYGMSVQKVNLLKRWPFEDNTFSAIYSCHVMEHFSPPQADHIIYECFRLLESGGILRIAVPDFEQVCSEYFRVLDEGNVKKYKWISLELFDQMTRATPSGEMGKYIKNIDPEMRSYIEERGGDRGIEYKKKGITTQKLKNKLFYIYLNTVSKLFPAHIRDQVMILTGLGERHRWMYDLLGMSILLKEHGFSNIKKQHHNTSDIPHFNEDCLDIDASGQPYKMLTLFTECRKP